MLRLGCSDDWWFPEIECDQSHREMRWHLKVTFNFWTWWDFLTILKWFIMGAFWVTCGRLVCVTYSNNQSIHKVLIEHNWQPPLVTIFPPRSGVMRRPILSLIESLGVIRGKFGHSLLADMTLHLIVSMFLVVDCIFSVSWAPVVDPVMLSSACRSGRWD